MKAPLSYNFLYILCEHKIKSLWTNVIYTQLGYRQPSGDFVPISLPFLEGFCKEIMILFKAAVWLLRV